MSPSIPPTPSSATEPAVHRSQTRGPRTNGPLLFARYAYPPNALGYCGPADHPALLQHADAGADPGFLGSRGFDDSMRGLSSLARRFDGAWPYLALIAAANGRADPLAHEVVEAYWIGNRLLERVPPALLAAQVTDRFADRLGPAITDPATLAVSGGRPHHNFHVFAVYPWLGLLRAGPVAEPLRVLDNCRISWGTVLSVEGDTAQVSTRPLTYIGGHLRLGVPITKPVTWSRDGYALGGRPAVGATVALHWGWICDLLDARRRAALRHYTRLHLSLVEQRIAESGPHPVTVGSQRSAARGTLP